MDEFDPKRLEKFVTWSEQWTTPLGEWNYLRAHVSLTSATLFARLMFPEFIEVRGCVIVREFYNPETFDGWWASLDGDRRAVEYNVNWLTMWDMWEPEGEDEEAALESVAAHIALSWKLQASLKFPYITWNTQVIEMYGPVVTLARVA